MRFGEVLKHLRFKKSMTQDQLAEGAGIPVGSVRGYEQGYRLPGLLIAIHLARALGVSLAAFAEIDEASGEELPPQDRRPSGALPRKKRRGKGVS